MSLVGLTDLQAGPLTDFVAAAPDHKVSGYEISKHLDRLAGHRPATHVHPFSTSIRMHTNDKGALRRGDNGRRRNEKR